MKRILIFLSAIVIIAILAIVAFSIGFFARKNSLETTTPIYLITPEPSKYVYDDSSLIDETNELEINSWLLSLKEKTQIDFFVITLNTDIDKKYAQAVYNSLEVEKSGILLLISSFNSTAKLAVDSKLEETLRNEYCKMVIKKNFTPYAKEGDYTNAIQHTIKIILKTLESEYKVEILE